MKPFRLTHIEKKFCPHCGKQNPITYKYCIECGYEIPDINFIPPKSNIQTRSDIEQNQPLRTVSYPTTVEKKRGYGRLIFFLSVAALLIYTNPSEKMHLDYIRKSIRNEMVNKSSPLDKFFISLFELGIGGDALNSYLNNYCKRTNYVFFSITELQLKDKKEPFTTFGILGNIFALEELKNSFDQLRIKYDL